MPSPADLLVPFRTGGDRPPLYCVPAASGSPYAYAGLARQLGPDQPVYGFEAPGFDDGREPLSSVPDLAAEYCAALIGASGPSSAPAAPAAPAAPGSSAPLAPIRLLGWSMGGAVALALADRLAALGVAVPLLVLVDSAAPAPAAPPAEPALIAAFLTDFGAAAGLSAALSAAAAGRADPQTAFRAVAAAGLLPPEVGAAVLQQRYAIYRAHALAAFRYPGPDSRYPGRLVSIRAAQTPSTAVRWEPFAESVVEHVVDGDHHSIWTGPGLAALERLVADHLAHTQEEQV